MKARGDRPRAARPGTARLRRTPRQGAVFDRNARCSGRWGRRSREPTADGLEHAFDLDESDRHVEVYSDGATTQRADTLDRNPSLFDQDQMKKFRRLPHVGRSIFCTSSASRWLTASVSSNERCSERGFAEKRSLCPSFAVIRPSRRAPRLAVGVKATGQPEEASNGRYSSIVSTGSPSRIPIGGGPGCS